MFGRFGIRRVRLADLDRILDIENHSFGEYAYDRNLFAEYHRECGELFLVAERGRSICGYALTRLSGDRRRAELVSVAVAPEARGRGAASALVKSTLRRLRLRGCRRIWLMVRESNAEAGALYTKFAFQRIRRVRRYYEDDEDGWMMAKTLGP